MMTTFKIITCQYRTNTISNYRQQQIMIYAYPLGLEALYSHAYKSLLVFSLNYCDILLIQL